MWTLIIINVNLRHYSRMCVHVWERYIVNVIICTHSNTETHRRTHNTYQRARRILIHLHLFTDWPVFHVLRAPSHFRSLLADAFMLQVASYKSVYHSHMGTHGICVRAWVEARECGYIHNFTRSSYVWCVVCWMQLCISLLFCCNFIVVFGRWLWRVHALLFRAFQCMCMLCVFYSHVAAALIIKYTHRLYASAYTWLCSVSLYDDRICAGWY